MDATLFSAIHNALRSGKYVFLAEGAPVPGVI